MQNTSQNIHYKHEKEFYEWLQNNRGVNENKSRHMVIELARLELLADTLNLQSTKLFSQDCGTVIETFNELIKTGALNKYTKTCKEYLVNPLDALKEYITYIISKLKAETQPKQKKPLLWTSNSTLYVYRGVISCQRNRHNIISATAVLLTKNLKTVEITVNYCKNCKKFFIGEEAFNTYKRHNNGLLIGRVRYEGTGTYTYNGDLLAEVSPLRLCGYTVSKTENLSEYERQYIISQVINNGIMTKPEVISYLEYFIDHNGRQERNQLAVEKWKRDLKFALSYNFDKQDRYLITEIQPYSYSGFGHGLVA